MSLKTFALAVLITSSLMGMTAIAENVGISLDIGVAPPPLQVEVMPAPQPGYVWAPGYWEW